MISERKKYLEKETYNINEVVRIKNNLEKNKTQFEQDTIAYEASSDKNVAKMTGYDETQVEPENTSDDLGHYINVEKQKELEAQRNLERQAEEKRKLEVEIKKKKKIGS